MDKLSNYLYVKPTTREELSTWVEIFLGFKIHDSVRCTEHSEEQFVGRSPHNSQLDYISGAFFNEYRNGVVLAARYAGKSYCAALVDFLDCLFKPGIWVCVVAWKREQADYIHTYLKKFLISIEEKTGVKLATVLKNEISFENGSRIDFYSGTSKGNIKGAHPDVLQVDEVDLFTMEEFRGMANALSASGKYPPRFDILSTNYSMAGEGVVIRQIESYQEYNKSKPSHLPPHAVFRICLLDILQKCDDRYICQNEETGVNCLLFHYCKGHAKKGEGFYSVENALATMSAGATAKGNFESEFLLLRPTAEHSYFYNFDQAENVKQFELNPDPLWDTFIAFDFGGSRAPHGAVIVQKSPDGVYHVVDEFESVGLLERMIDSIKAKYPKCTDFICYYDPAGNRKDNTIGAKSHRDILKKCGFFPTCKQLKRRATFEQIFALILGADKKVRLIVNKRCRKLIDQITSAEHQTKHGRLSPEPVDPKDYGGDEHLDCLRYIVGRTMGTYAKIGGRQNVLYF